ncbi:MAG: hypothetical protein QXT84_07240 [Candidatus Bathyarchaeia archaeon]
MVARLNPQGKMIDFGGIITNGSARLTTEDGALVITPLPNSPQFELRILWNSLPWQLKRAQTVEEMDEAGNVLASYPLQWEGDFAVLTIRPGVFAYRLR